MVLRWIKAELCKRGPTSASGNKRPLEGFVSHHHLRTRVPTGVHLRAAAATALAATVLAAPAAHAVPAFAVQTGQPCQACHVGGFGPQLTPYGRAFKLGGYTTRTVDNLPFSAMAVASYLRTQKDQASPPADGYKRNDNAALDQVSVFVAGGLGSHLGAFVQTTYDGIGETWSWDNLDLRAVTKVTVGGADVLLGASVNNSPTVQDAWNTTPAWGFPYTGSALAPGPAASPLLAGGLAQNTLGLTGYAWINSELLVELGGYSSPSRRTLAHLGADPFAPGDIHGVAPYGRVAWQKTLAGGTLELGAMGMRAEIYPARDRSAATTDRYTDLGVDGSWFKALDNGDVLTFNGRYLHERQSLDATCILAGEASGCANIRLEDLRFDASYYWRNKIGLTLGAFDTFGSSNAFVYAANRTLKPDSSGLMIQVDGTPFGGEGSPLGPRFNMRVGVQYTMYTSFDGASHDYDGAGAKAADNNTLRLFTWFAY
jgi:hypothetical protein